MSNFAHNSLIKDILRIDQLPTGSAAYANWIEAGAHLNFLDVNAKADELVIYGLGPYSFIHTLAVPNSSLAPIDRNDLLRWNNVNPFTHIASFVSGGGRPGIWIERENAGRASKSLEKGMDLIFGRYFEGLRRNEGTYFEVNQEYAHLSGIHWRPERNAYCRFDDNGDFVNIVSVTLRGEEKVTLVSFSWPKLEEYLAISDSSLVRVFDFTLLNRETFSNWPNAPEKIIERSPAFFYRQKVTDSAAYTRGVQIIRIRSSASRIMNDIQNGWTGKRQSKYVEFIAKDWRNKRTASISTDPSATTNYFSTDGNDLPFELSPAFFRPEVLSKYKADREKYKVSDREISCRGAWTLQGYDVNDAGQVHAYICDLRSLPYSEQLYWRSYNEEPKASISERAVTTDFKGEFSNHIHPRDEIISIVRRWNDQSVQWWKLKDLELLDRANPPLTSSRDEWANAFLDLSRLLTEGFETKTIRKWLMDSGVTFKQEEQSISLLQKLIAHRSVPGENIELSGLRSMQSIRSKVASHSGGSEGRQLLEKAIAQYGSLATHFKHICTLIVSELEVIEKTCQEFQ